MSFLIEVLFSKYSVISEWVFLDSFLGNNQKYIVYISKIMVLPFSKYLSKTLR